MFPGTDAEAVLTAFRGWLADLPDEACPSIALLRLPDVPFVPEPLRGQFVVHLRFAFAGSKEEGDRLLAPMRAVSQVIMDTAGPMSYEQIDLVNLDPPEPIPYQEGGALLAEFDDAAQAALLQVAGPGAQTPLLLVELRPMGGALARPAAGRDAVAGRDAAMVAAGHRGACAAGRRTRAGRHRGPARRDAPLVDRPHDGQLPRPCRRCHRPRPRLAARNLRDDQAGEAALRPEQHDALRARGDPAQRRTGRRGRTALSRTVGPVGRQGQVDEVVRGGVGDAG